MIAWSLVIDHGERLTQPSWQSVYEALLRQDGGQHSYAALEHPSGKSVLIGAGGNEGYFVVTFIDMSRPDHIPYTLVEGLEGPEVELMVEGVADLFPAEICVRRETMVKAFRGFFESGVRPEDLKWSE